VKKIFKLSHFKAFVTFPTDSSGFFFKRLFLCAVCEKLSISEFSAMTLIHTRSNFRYSLRRWKTHFSKTMWTKDPLKKWVKKKAFGNLWQNFSKTRKVLCVLIDWTCDSKMHDTHHKNYRCKKCLEMKIYCLSVSITLEQPRKELLDCLQRICFNFLWCEKFSFISSTQQAWWVFRGNCMSTQIIF